MSKGAMTFTASGMVGKVAAELTLFEESGTATKQVTLTMVSGHRVRIVEGMMAFANAECLRQGDIIEFTFSDILKGSYKAGKDTDKERDVQTLDLIGIGEVRILEVGAFSDVADKVLLDAGRKPLTYVERTVKAKEKINKLPPAPPTPGTTVDTTVVADTTSPFTAEH